MHAPDECSYKLVIPQADAQLTTEFEVSQKSIQELLEISKRLMLDHPDPTPGQRATIIGLGNEPALNCRECQVREQISSGRFIVTLSGGRSLSIKPSNLGPTRSALVRDP